MYAMNGMLVFSLFQGQFSSSRTGNSE